VNGTPLMLEKEFQTIDMEKTLENSQKIALELTS
jgi:hypothetical protein